MAVVHAAAATLTAKLAVDHPTSLNLVRPVTIALLVGVALAWGGVDGWLRRPNRGLTWFFAALAGGVVAAVLGVVGQAAFVDQTGIWALGGALGGAAPFTALLIMVPAGLGIAVGGRMLEPPAKAAASTAEPVAESVARPVSRSVSRPASQSVPKPSPRPRHRG